MIRIDCKTIYLAPRYLNYLKPLLTFAVSNGGLKWNSLGTVHNFLLHKKLKMLVNALKIYQLK